MIEIRGISKTYRAKKGGECRALKNVSAKFGDTGMYFILGKSGSGKSTLLNVLGGLDKVDSGEIIYNGKSFSEFKQSDFENYRNREVGFIFQEYNLIEDFDVYANISIALELQPERDKTKDKEAIEHALQRVELTGYGKRRVGELSGGQKQRVAIARAIVKNSSVILADEPTGNLDSETGEDVFNLLKSISKEKLVIVVSHDRENAEEFGDGILYIKDGVAEEKDFTAVTVEQKTGEEQKEEGIKAAGEKVDNDFGAERNEGEEKRSKKAKIKLPLSYSFKMAFKNLGQKKFKTLFTVVSTFILLIFTCGMYVFYDFNSERNIALTASNNEITHLIIKGTTNKEIPYNIGHFSVNDIYDFGCYAYMDNFSNIKYSAGFNVVGFESFSDYNYSIPSESLAGESIVNRFFDVSAYIIESEKDITDLNFTLYENSVKLPGGVYVSDLMVKSMLNKGLAFADGTTDYNKMGGKVISNGNMTFIISGVFKTGFSDLFSDEISYSHSVKINKELTAIETNRLNKIAGAVFMDKYTFLSGYVSDNIDPVDFSGKKFSFSVTDENGVNYPIDFVNTYSPNGFLDDFILTAEGMIPFPEMTLGENEILVSPELYNELFPDDKIIWNEENHQENVKIPKNLGKTLDVSFNQPTVKKDYLGLEGMVIKGVDFSMPKQLRVITSFNIESRLDPEWILLLNNNNILLYTKDYNGLAKMLRGLRTDYLMGVDDDFMFPIYYFEQVASQIAKVFLVLLLISLLTSMLLLINLISFGVAARRKEIGILKALGTGNAELKKTYIIQTLLIGAFSFILGLFGTYWFVGFANSQIVMGVDGLVWFVMTPFTYLLMAAQTFFIMPVLALIPLRRITSLNPVDAIKK